MCFCTEYSATCKHTSVAWGMSVSFQVHTLCVNQGGTTDKFYSSLTDLFSVKDVSILE